MSKGKAILILSLLLAVLCVAIHLTDYRQHHSFQAENFYRINESFISKNKPAICPDSAFHTTGGTNSQKPSGLQFVSLPN